MRSTRRFGVGRRNVRSPEHVDRSAVLTASVPYAEIVGGGTGAVLTGVDGRVDPPADARRSWSLPGLTSSSAPPAG